MPRESIAMPRQGWLAFLAQQRWVVLGTLDADGAPWAALAPAALQGDELCFAAAAGGRSQRNLERDPRACCAADAFPSYYEIRGATVHGRARPIRDAQQLALLVPQLDPRGLPGWPDPPGETRIWALPLDDVFSFDFGRIRNRLE